MPKTSSRTRSLNSFPIAAAIVLTSFHLAAQECVLYPIALSAQSLSNAAPNAVLDIFNGGQPGNFGWISWGGSPSEPTLVASLTPPGNSATYVNPDDPHDHQVSVGDWLSSKPGVSNSKNVRDALDVLKTLDITVPVWDQACGQGATAAFRVSGFARVRLISHHLPQQNRITAQFLGFTACDAPNLPPTVNAGPDQTITLSQTASLAGAVSDDGLPVGGALTATWSKVSGLGTVTFADAHSATTTAQFSEPGTYVLNLAASDSQLGASDDAIVTVNRENRPPVPLPPAVVTDEDTAVAITLAGSDPDGDPLSFTVVTVPNHGTLSGTPPALLYTPIPDYHGQDGFTYKVNDGQLDSSNAVVNITINPVNDAPVADPLSITNNEDTAFVILLSGSDVEGSALTYTILSGPTNGTINGTAPTLTYQPSTNFFGQDHLVFKVNDGTNDSAPALVSITILPVDDVPLVDAGPDQLTVLPTNTVNLAGSVNDDDFPGAVQTVLWSQLSGPGTVTFGNVSNAVTTASFSQSGIYELELFASDSFLSASNSVIITVNATPLVNAGPNQTNTLPASVPLQGIATDDGVPTNGVLTVTWSKVSGPGSVVFADPQSTNTTAAFSESGTYVLRLSATDGISTSSSDVLVVMNRAPVVDAGSDQLTTNLQVTINGTVFDDGLPSGAPLVTLWTQVSGPGTATFAPAAPTNGQPVTTATFSDTGVHVLRLSADDSLAVSSDEVTISINAAPVVSAGPNQTMFINGSTQLAGSVTDDGLPPGVALDVHWTVVSGPGVMAIGDSTSPTTTASFNLPGTYVLRLSASDSMLTSSSDVTITVRPVNHPPAVFAGTNQIVLFPAAATLDGIVTDDGEPQGGILTTLWSKVTGPGNVTFADPASLNTTAAFSQSGVYVLALVASDSELNATNYVMITANRAPVVDAGPDQVTTVSNVITLSGSIDDDGLPWGTTNVTWIQVSGPGQAVFTQSVSAVTPVRFTVAGSYHLRLYATDAHAVGLDDVVVTVRVAGENMPPFVTAGSDQYVAPTNRTVLQGIASDDGLPDGSALNVSWALVSGPGTVVFDDTNSPISAVTFGTAGDYVLRLTVSDTEFTVADDVAVRVYPGNQPPIVGAGGDQTIVTGPATLSGTVSDDGLPASQPLTFFWSKASGPGSVSFANSNSAITTVSFSEAGQYILRFTASDTQFAASDDVTLTVTGNQPPLVNAGPDQVLDLVTGGGASVSTVTYPSNPDAWRLESGQPGLTGLWGGTSFTRVDPNGLSWNGTNLYVGGGGFMFANGVEVRNLARWSGCTYSALFDPRPSIPSNPSSAPIGFISIGSPVAPIAARGSEVFVAGGFLADLEHDGFLDFTARWTGTGWEPWHFVIASGVVANSAMVATSDAIYFGGTFKFKTNNASGAPISFNIAKWDGTNWVVLGEGIRDVKDTTNRNDTQFGVVNAIAVATNGVVYAGGRFITQTPTGLATNLARWNGTNWAPVGVALTGCGGFNCSAVINALVIAPNGDLLVGGNFTQAGSLVVNHVARWDGTNWFALGSGVNFQSVHALTYRGNDLYIGGDFTQTGSLTVNRIARWSGTNWFALSNGVNSRVTALAATTSGVFAGGQFFTVGSQTANFIAKWGGKELPTLNGPAPITFTGAPATGAWVPVSVAVSHPCGSAMTLTWNVDGGPAEHVDSVPAILNSSPQTISFTNLYSPGVHTLVVTLNDGANGPVTFSTTVTVLTPATTTLAGTITDDGLPAGTVIGNWDQSSGPASVTFSRPSVTNAPPVTEASFTAVGTYVLRLTGSDTALAATDTLTVNVRAAGNANLPPSVNAGPDLFIPIDEPAVLNGVALDDGLPSNSLNFSWAQITGPGTTTFDPPAANVTSLAATFSAPGIYVLRLTGSDTDLTSFDEVTVTVSGVTNAPPVVNAGPDQTIGLADSATLAGTATDDGLPYGTLVSGWSQSSGPGTVLFRVQNGVTFARFSEVGDYVLRFTANDGRTAAFDEVGITVLSNTPGPIVQLLSPLDSAIITAPTIVTGTVSTELLQSWILQYRLKPAEDALPAPVGEAVPWSVLASNTVTVISNTLATFDPTLLLNGIYELRLTATDLIGRTVTTEPVTLIVDRNLKIGHFTVSFNDLTIPVAGLPLQITRTYDSRAAAAGIQGDFGIGWTMDIRNIRLQKNRSLSRNWEETVTGDPFQLSLAYHLNPGRERIVTITFPDGRVEKFRFDPNPLDQALLPIGNPRWRFTPLANTRGTLVPAGYDEPDGQFLYFAGSIPGTADLYDLNYFFEWLNSSAPVETLQRYPTLFRYTSQEGYRYLIDEIDGLQSVTDPNGNTLLVSTNGLTWTHPLSAPGGEGQGEVAPTVSIAFQRDTLGRITNIVDAAGNAMRYAYGSNGDLVSFTDRVGQTNGFAYTNTAFPHHLTGMTDARGIQPMVNHYDPAGRLVGHTDAAGEEIEYTHDVSHRISSVRNRLGFVTTQEYDVDGNIVRAVDPLGGVTTCTYDVNGNRLTRTDPLGHTTRYLYTATNQALVAVVNALDETNTFTYNAQGMVTSATERDGTPLYSFYDARNNITNVVDTLGFSTVYAYNQQGKPIYSRDALGNESRSIYDAFGNLVSGTNALGHVSEHGYDTNNRPIRQVLIRTTNGVTQRLTNTWAYDAQGRVTSAVAPDGSLLTSVYDEAGHLAATIDELNRQTIYEYDSLGRLVRTAYPDGTSDSIGYDAEDRKVAVTNRLGQVMRYVYDPLNRLVSTIQPDGTANTNYFDAASRLIASSDAKGNTTWFGHDALGRVIATTNALLEITTFAYDGRGNQLTSADALGRTTTNVFDLANRLVAVLFPDGTTASNYFDPLGRRTFEQDQAGKVTAYGYDALGRLVAVTNALGYITRYEYNELGEQTAQIDASGRITRYEYDERGRRTSRILPLGQSDLAQYDPVGNLTSYRDFNGNVTSFQYDSLNRLVLKTPDSRLGEPNVAFAYNALGQRTNMVDASGVTSYRYDARNRLVEKATPQGTLAYAYDANGNVTNIVSSNPNGTAITHEYDPLNRLAAMNDSHLGRTFYSYDSVGNLRSWTTPNGVNHFHEYDALNRLTNVNAARLLTPLANYAYTVSPTGQRTSVTESGGRVVNYAYDRLNQLTNETITASPDGRNGSLGYAYDAVGNRLARNSSLPGILAGTYSFDANDRLFSDAYDANGNTLGATLRESLSGTSQAVNDRYDFENRLVNRNNGQIQVVYDGDGNRVRKTVITATNTITTRYLVDDLNPTGYPQVVEELTSSSSLPTPTVTCTYTWGHVLLAQDRLGGAQWRESYPGYDGQNSVRFLTDAMGQVTDTYDYDAFGNLIARTGTTINAYLYQGEQFDADLGLCYLRARYADPDRGRFWTMDGFEGFGGDPQSLHKYTFCHNDPVNRRDPSGHFSLGEQQTVNALAPMVRGGLQALQREMLACRLLSATTAGMAGGAIGGTLSAGITAIIQTYAGDGLDWGEISQAFSEGFSEGFMAGFSLGFSPFTAGPYLGYSAFMSGLEVWKHWNDPTVPTWLKRAEMASFAASLVPLLSSTVARRLSALLQKFCFPAGTEVATADGQKPIEEIQEGDLVWAQSDQTGEIMLKRVKQVFVNVAASLVVLTAGTNTLEATPEHPLWVADQGWKAAGQIQAGDELWTRSGERITVTGIAHKQGQFTVYNFEVEDSHTYFAGSQRVLVHNSCRVNISTISKDWITKGFHIKVDGLELRMFTKVDGKIGFGPIFSSDAAPEVRAAIKKAEMALEDPRFRKQAYDAAERARNYLGQYPLGEELSELARGTSGEMNFLMEALRNFGK